MDTNLVFWLVFSGMFAVVFSIDLFATGRRKDCMQVKAALKWTALWVSTALIFGAMIYFYFPEGKVKGFEFIASYLVEYSLSVDNLFVFIMIFTVMGITAKHQPRILKWGIIGAVVLRIIFIVAGVGLIQKFQFMTYVFGLVLIYTAYKMMTSEDAEIEPEKNIFVRLASRFIKIDCEADTDNFFIRQNKKICGTVAFVTLLLIESTDVIFAVDSIPAVLSITQDPFIAITSNLFAILGLRSLFFALSGLLHLFRFLKYGITVILLFVGVKMLISAYLHIPVQLSLAIIILCLATSIIISVLVKDPESLSKIDGLVPIPQESQDRPTSCENFDN